MRTSNPKYAKRRIVALLAIFALVAVGTVAYANKGRIRDVFEQLAGNDYVGSGHGSVQISIASGDTGEIVALKLEAAGVVKDFRNTYKIILELNPTFYPGTFNLAKQMSSRSAIEALTSGASAAIEKITIKEGMRLTGILKLLSEKTGIPRSELDAAASDLSLWHLPAAAPSLEGYLFPATYSFAPDVTAKQAIGALRDRMDEEISKFNIPAEKVHRVLTLAGLIQKEARQTQDFYKVSRVFLNRIKAGMKLQSDATVSYGVGGSTVNTSAAERATDNPYNTYLHAGLPVGPISAPGSVAIDAALNPASGNWLYFVTVNLETGETVFSNTYAEHEKAVELWRAWMKEHPTYE